MRFIFLVFFQNRSYYWRGSKKSITSAFCTYSYLGKFYLAVNAIFTLFFFVCFLLYYFLPEMNFSKFSLMKYYYFMQQLKLSLMRREFKFSMPIWIIHIRCVTNCNLIHWKRSISDRPKFMYYFPYQKHSRHVYVTLILAKCYSLISFFCIHYLFKYVFALLRKR